MIPRKRPVVDAAGAASMLGMAYQTFRTKGVAHEPGFPAPVNPGRRKLLYDRQQVEAFRDGQPLPELPAPGHPDDLLDEKEAAQELGLAYATVRKDRNDGRMPPHIELCGLPHWPRHVLQGITREPRRSP
ncbi:hypothetical protein [Actinomadura sp. NPDC048394]|uniref:hypothetical protein n=1 Tax=Actinomadura sp. NPDC048394 TaxID=3158223 RepID=UPI0033DCA274